MEPRSVSKGISAVLVTLSVLLFQACSDNSKAPSATALPPKTDTAVETTLINGQVVKGAVSNAQVDFYTINPTGVASTQAFATVITDENGEFELELETLALPELLYIEVLGAADGGTTMSCDAEVCGSTSVLSGDDTNGDGFIGWKETIYLSPDFKLSAILADFKNSAEISIAVTPLSHLAVQRAIAENNLSRENVLHHVGIVASLFNLSENLMQAPAVDITSVTAASTDGTEDPATILDMDEINYGLLNSMFAEYASRKGITIEESIELVAGAFYTDHGSFSRELVIELLDAALANARYLSGEDVRLQQLITDLQLLIVRYTCNVYGDSCDPITPIPPTIDHDEELATVKAFVSDFRAWSKDLAEQTDPVVEKIKGRVALIDNLWEKDFKEMSAVLSDLLPGIAQTVSPSYSFCYICYNRGQPLYTDGSSKTLLLYGLEYNLEADGAMHIGGELRGITVDIDLQIPDIHEWAQTQTIEITGARLSKNNLNLVLSEGSHITVVYQDEQSFSQIARAINSDYYELPEATELSLVANIFLQSDISVRNKTLMDFEDDNVNSGVQFTGNWSIDSTKSATGSRSLKSNRITHRQNTRTTAEFTTEGGYLSYSYAVSSESRYDYLNVYIDGNRVLRLAGDHTNFATRSHYLSPGRHTVIWEYAKDGSVNRGSDAAWIDNIQFPAIIGDNSTPEKFEARNVLSGSLALTIQHLDAVWAGNHSEYLPSDLQVQATLSSDFTVDDVESGYDQITIRLAANIANAADFSPPQALGQGTLKVLGNYTVEADLFELTTPNGRATISRDSDTDYIFSEYLSGEEDPYSTSHFFSEYSEIEKAAGDIIGNSGIGHSLIVSEQGLYLSLLLNTSPWEIYETSQFSADGGDIYGFLVQNYNPLENATQYLKIATSLELEIAFSGLQTMVVSTQLSRESLNNGDLSFSVEYDGRRLNFSSELWYSPSTFIDDASLTATSPNLTVRNQDGVSLLLSMDSTEALEADGKRIDSLKGELIYNNTVYGDIERIKGITLIRYTDGSAESFE